MQGSVNECNDGGLHVIGINAPQVKEMQNKWINLSVLFAIHQSCDLWAQHDRHCLDL